MQWQATYVSLLKKREMRIILLLFLIVSISCSKENSCEECIPSNTIINAQVRWTGPVAGDGCDWSIVTDANEHFHPDNLTDEFKQDQLQVQLTYTLTNDKFLCGWGVQMPVIHLLSIKK
jgi:hypothetical protein